MSGVTITFSTCWYEFKAKFDPSVYYRWIDNMLSATCNYYLVIYTDEQGAKRLQKYADNNPCITIVVKPFEQLYNYKYKDFFIENHKKNDQLNKRVDWQVNLLWCEKVHFVAETMEKNHCKANHSFYGWCDIGYFREKIPNTRDYGEFNHLPMEMMKWPDPNKVRSLDTDVVYYACINNNMEYMKQLQKLITTKNSVGLPKTPIPPNQLSIAGGFFVTHRDNVKTWQQMFDERLELYIDNDYLVKDDQMVIIDCIFSYPKLFRLITEKNNNTDSVWFLFQRYLAEDGKK